MTSERLTRTLFAAAAAGVALFAACADLSRGPAPAGMDGGAGAGGSAMTDAGASFAADVHGILTGSCMRCHAAGGEAADTSFLLTGEAPADLTTPPLFIDLNPAAASRLLAKMSGNGHGG